MLGDTHTDTYTYLSQFNTSPSLHPRVEVMARDQQASQATNEHQNHQPPTPAIQKTKNT